MRLTCLRKLFGLCQLGPETGRVGLTEALFELLRLTEWKNGKLVQQIVGWGWREAGHTR